jgi:hypothetical protein
MKYLVVPAIIWIWTLHKSIAHQSTDIAVLRAEAAAREIARTEERKATTEQLNQILSTLQTINGRIDAMMMGRQG